jgi:aspartate dehydrogenase
MRRLGIIGGGGMARTVLAAVGHAVERVSLLLRPGHTSTLAGAVHTELAAFLADGPELVVECAGHEAVRQYGAAVLERGCDLVVISIGALADDALHARLREAALRGGAQLLLPAGAIGGIDALAAAKLSGLEEVAYVGRKPPRAWRGTPAERLLDLESLDGAQSFFEGSARDAARDYPQNANVAAIVALAGAGFDATRVRLVADPAITRNVHELTVRSACSDFTIRLEGRASPDNPKTSLMAGYSVARAVLNHAAALVI